MPKPKPVKKVVPVEELKTSPFTEVIELERTITPDEKLRGCFTKNNKYRYDDKIQFF